VTQPHVPGWLEDAVAHLVAVYEAEAVFLLAAPDATHAPPSPEQRLAVLVDNEAAPGRGLPPLYRWEPLEGYPGPVRFIRATLAELMAGAYGGGSAWGDLLQAAWPLHDPLGYERRMLAQRESMRIAPLETAVGAARNAVEEAKQAIAAGNAGVAHLLALRAGDELATWLARREGLPGMDAHAVVSSAGHLSPGVARAFAELLEAADSETRVEALGRFADAVDATLRLRNGQSS
jgi:hypothetical protein